VERGVRDASYPANQRWNEIGCEHWLLDPSTHAWGKFIVFGDVTSSGLMASSFTLAILARALSVLSSCKILHLPNRPGM
jgi:hypothetical protein